MVLTPINENNDASDKIINLSSRPHQPNVDTINVLYWINRIIMHSSKSILISVACTSAYIWEATILGDPRSQVGLLFRPWGANYKRAVVWEPLGTCSTVPPPLHAVGWRIWTKPALHRRLPLLTRRSRHWRSSCWAGVALIDPRWAQSYSLWRPGGGGLRRIIVWATFFLVWW